MFWDAAVAPQSGLDQLLGSLAGNSTVILAVLGLIGGIIAAKVIKPPTYAEIVKENRDLREDRVKADARTTAAETGLSELRTEFETFKRDRDTERAADRRRIMILSDGVEAMWSWAQTLVKALHDCGQDVPEPSEYVQDIMQRARDARTNDISITTPKESSS